MTKLTKEKQEMKDMTIPLTVEDKRKWWEHFMKFDAIIGNLFKGQRIMTFDDVTKDELMTMLLVKCQDTAQMNAELVSLRNSNEANHKNFEASQRTVRELHGKVTDAQDLCRSQKQLQSENEFLRGLVNKLTDRSFSYEDGSIRFRLGDVEKKQVEPS